MKVSTNLKKLKDTTFFFASAMNFVVLVSMILFFYAKYGSELDIIMQTILYGVSSEGWYSSHLMFSNIFLGGILSVLMKMLPMVAWYTVFHYAMSFISMFFISYIIISYNNSTTGKIIATITSVFIGYECYILPMYMKTAVLLAVTCVILLRYIILSGKERGDILNKKQKRRHYVKIILAGLWGVIGSWVSYKVFFAVFLMTLIGVCFMEFRRRGNVSLRFIIVIAIVSVASISCHKLDSYLYTNSSLWSEAGEYREAVEQLYAFGFPTYKDVEVAIKSSGYNDVDEETYNALKDGMYLDEQDNFALLQLISEQRMKLSLENVSLFLHVIPMRAFKTGMFYLWMIFAMIILLQLRCARIFRKLIISLVMVCVSYVFMFFRYGNEAQCLGMIAYLPAIAYLLLNLKNCSFHDERYIGFHLGLFGLVLYYLFSGTIVNSVQNNVDLGNVATLGLDSPENAHLIDFNYYIQGFSIYNVYPRKVDSGNTFIVNGVYELVPGFRTVRDLASGEYGSWNGYEIYSRNDASNMLVARNIAYGVDLSQYGFTYGETLQKLTHVIYYK